MTLNKHTKALIAGLRDTGKDLIVAKCILLHRGGVSARRNVSPKRHRIEEDWISPSCGLLLFTEDKPRLRNNPGTHCVVALATGRGNKNNSDLPQFSAASAKQPNVFFPQNRPAGKARRNSDWVRTYACMIWECPAKFCFPG